jgi:hypothetical protein
MKLLKRLIFLLILVLLPFLVGEAADLQRMMYDPCHFTGEGYAHLGSYIAKKIVEALK